MAAVFRVLDAGGEGHLLFLLLADSVLVGLAASERVEGGRRVVVLFAICLLELTVLFCLLLLQHLSDFEEELVDALARLGGDGIVGHLVLLDELLQLFLFEIPE